MYNFDAHPRKIIYSSKKLKNKIPLEEEKKYIKAQEKKKQESILRMTIENFKKNSKTSPFLFNMNKKFKIKTNLKFFIIDMNQEEVQRQDQQTETLCFSVKEGNERKEAFQQQNFINKKKTGRDQGNQVQITSIFDVEKELDKIIRLMKTKILEESLLEVEQEMELINLEAERINNVKNEEKELTRWKEFIAEEEQEKQKKVTIQ